MPELPEVETIKLELNELIKGKIISSVEVNLAKEVKTPLAVFKRKVKGAKIKAVQRRAKMLLIEIVPRGQQKSEWLVFHLKMTGQIIYQGKQGKLAGGGHPIGYGSVKNNFSESETGSLGSARDKLLANLPNKYSHVIFNLDDGSHIFFNDTRQFGWVKLVNEQELKKMEEKLGPEPLEINWREFSALIKDRKTAIKPLLMEQKVLAGVGNIYAQEACWCAKISPLRKADSLSEQEIKELFDCLKKILRLAIEKRGTTAANYVDVFGRQGSMWPYLKVYGRAGEKCLRCGKKLKQIKQAQRSTVYCAGCQK